MFAVAVAIAFTATDAHARRCGGRRSHCHARPQCHTYAPVAACNTCVPTGAPSMAPVAKPYEDVNAPADAAPAPAPAPADAAPAPAPAPAADAPAAPAPAPAAEAAPAAAAPAAPAAPAPAAAAAPAE